MDITARWVRWVPQRLRERIADSRHLAPVLGNIGWLSGDRILRMGIGFIVGVWLARYLGSEGFGLLSYAAAFVALFSPLATLGIESIVIRDLVRDPASRGETLGTAFALRVAGAVLMWGLVTGAICLTGAEALSRGMVIVLASGAIAQAFDAIDYWFQSQVRAKYTVYAKNAAFLIITVAKIVLLWRQASLMAFVVAAVAETVLGAAGLVWIYVASGERIREWKLSLQRGQQLLTSSWPLLLSGVVVMTYMRIDQVMLRQMKGDHEIGIYAAAAKLSEIWYCIPIAIASSVFPAIVTAKAESAQAYARRVQQLLTVMVLIGYCVAIPAIFCSHRAIHVIFGGQFEGAGASLAILSWAGVFAAVGVARECWMVSEGLVTLSLLTTALGAMVNVALNLWFIPRFGATGAAAATLIAQFSAVTLSTVLFPQTRSMFLLQVRALSLRGLLSRRCIR